MTTGNKKILYLSYDGMSDHIGQSQVLPYLIASSERGMDIHILSFEKKQNEQKIAGIQSLLEKHAIKWFKIKFNQGGDLSKVYDYIKFFFSAFYVCIKYRYDIVHCRSYTASNIGLLLHYILGRKIIFDKRDFWIDAKIETGRINPDSSFSHNLINKFLRFFERRLFLDADHIISLTEKAKQVVLQKYPSRKPEDITVIPCCVDLNLFNKNKLDQGKVTTLRSDLGLDGAFVLGYVGSIGSTYMIPTLFECFKAIQKAVPEAKLLFMVNNDKEEVYKAAAESQVSRENLVVTSASRPEMPLHIALVDMGIFFITPTFAKQATSPTKLFEMLAMNKPIITNAGVGDAEKIFNDLQCGYLLNNFTEEEFKNVARWVKANMAGKQFDLSCYSLEFGARKYYEVYQKK
ncbi:glycosyltransferase family 4 protein [Adhaeribacter sp. BT258]|uniref:Glycosyltransferase family 4 protein n=1 Tax=Adhaeribacter terrigena TaxID=2793070 RepID=A0ABS1BX51_9BACT|nr:glycosyltransferase family 4 protein [Adhaeribacter terrigena]MBK0401725.1 glycosyltransferase family 4 protein [Adhaeribacter terrigena]